MLSLDNAPSSWLVGAGGAVLYAVLLSIMGFTIAGFPGPKLAASIYWHDYYYEVLQDPFPGQGTYEIERLHSVYGEFDIFLLFW
jgi:hypothetical protein